ELRARFNGDVVFEPRHETWFGGESESLLRAHRIARVAADPARVPAAAQPGGHAGAAYYRLHGSPRIYYSAYPAETLAQIAGEIEHKTGQGILTWCIFDNTALGAATTDALALKSYLLENQILTR